MILIDLKKNDRLPYGQFIKNLGIAGIAAEFVSFLHEIRVPGNFMLDTYENRKFQTYF